MAFIASKESPETAEVGFIGEIEVTNLSVKEAALPSRGMTEISATLVGDDFPHGPVTVTFQVPQDFFMDEDAETWGVKQTGQAEIDTAFYWIKDMFAVGSDFMNPATEEEMEKIRQQVEAEINASHLVRSPNAKKPGGGVPHGTKTAYQYGCRCEKCKDVRKAQWKEERTALLSRFGRI